MSLYLCVDCGGSKTSAAISDASGNIVARALGGPSNYAYLGPELFLAAVSTAVLGALQACTPANVPAPLALPPTAVEHQFAAAWFGISGVDGAAAAAECAAALSPVLGLPVGPRLVVANDTALLAAPLRTLPDASAAVTAIAGTGSCVVAFGRDARGAPAEHGRTGGWGWILGDEGGGFHVGREAVRAVLHAEDTASLGGAPPDAGPGALRTAVLVAFGVPTPLDALIALHTEGPAAGLLAGMPREKRLSALAPAVFACAFEHACPLALAVLRDTAAALAAQIALMLRAEDAEDASRPRAVRASEAVLCFGGSLVGVQAYREFVLEALKEKGHVFKHVEFVADPAATGAAGLAVAAMAERDADVV
jgi:N-acetylglucosamine kinase-like BadF-type ATPase